MPFGEYNISATNPQTQQTTTISNVQTYEGQSVRQDIELAIDQPDLQISTIPASGYIGANIYDLADQTIAKIAQQGNNVPYKTQPFYIRLVNEGNSAQAMVVKGPAAQSPSWTVTYYDDTTGTDITAAVTSATGWWTGWPDAPTTLPALGGMYDHLEVDITPNGAAVPNEQQSVILQATYYNNYPDNASDEVEAILRVPGPLEAPVTLTATPPSPSLTQTNITLQANINPSGFGQLLYKFNCQNPDGSTSILQDFSASSTCVWTPATASPPNGPDYQLSVVVEDTGTIPPTPLVSSPLDYQVTAPQLTKVVLTTLNPLTNTQTTNGNTYQPVQLVATANGGGEPAYQFTVSYVDANNVHHNNVILAPFGPSPTFTFTPTYATSYTFLAQCEDLEQPNTASISSLPVSYSVTTATLTSVTLAANPKAPSPVNVPITLTATPNGGFTDSFQFTATLAGTSQTIQDFSASSTCVWIPAKPGTYTLAINVKDTGVQPQTTASGTLSYQVTAALSGVSLSANPPSQQTLPVVPPVMLTATAAGGANVEYQFISSDNQGNDQIMLQDYSVSATCAWTPLAVGTYTLTVNAKDLNGGANPEPVNERHVEICHRQSLERGSTRRGPALALYDRLHRDADGDRHRRCE